MEKRGLEGRTDRIVKADMEGGGEEYVINTCDFILNSKCAKIVWWPGCARTRKGILSVPLDSQRHSERSEKEHSLTPLTAVMCVLQLGRDGEGGLTGIGKGNWKEV